MSFGEKLTKLRKEKGLNQEELAQELNVSRQAVSKWESNNSYPETDKIIQICKIFNVSMDELIGLKEVSKEKQEQDIYSMQIDEQMEKLKLVNVGTVVNHKKFGKGKIIWINQKRTHIKVSFENGDKQFVFPNAFLEGYLSF